MCGEEPGVTREKRPVWRRRPILIAGVFLAISAAVFTADWHLRAVAEARLVLHSLDDVHLESRHDVVLGPRSERPLSFGHVEIHTDPPVFENFVEDPWMLGMSWEDGSGLSLSQPYEPMTLDQRGGGDDGRLPIDDLVGILQTGVPSFWELVLSRRERILKWNRLGLVLSLGDLYLSGGMHLMETSDGTALVSCAKDDYVGVPERAWSLRGRWWAADGSVSFAFTYFWPEGEEPFEEDVCLEKARDLVSRIRMSGEGRDEPGLLDPIGPE